MLNYLMQLYTGVLSIDKRIFAMKHMSMHKHGAIFLLTFIHSPDDVDVATKR